MIGLGSNRLTCCRRGGMSVTQAGRGGMELLAGWRGPRWASPYSAQATAALLAQFPTRWPTIRDYGFAHPEIVGYMNAYAVTYPDIALELCKIGRCVIQGDNASYFNTGYIPKNNSRLEVGVYLSGDNRMFLGTRSGMFKNGFGIGYDPADKMMYDGWTGRTLYKNITMNEWHDVAIDLGKGKGYFDNVEFPLDVTTGSFSSATKPLFMLAINNAGSVAYWGGAKCIESASKIYEGSTLVHWYIGIENNKILDVATGEIINKSGSGTVTYSTLIA